MANFIFPQRDLDRPSRLLELLGSFWSSIYEGQAAVQRYVHGRARLEQQTEQDVQETLDCLSSFKVPIFHTRLWQRLILRESDLASDRNQQLRYEDDTTAVYEPTSVYHYDEANTVSFAFPVPAELHNIPWLFNRLTDPSCCLLDGMDFRLDATHHFLIFRDNPFLNPLLPLRVIYDGDTATDREIAVWAFHAAEEQSQIWRHYGSVLRLAAPSSENYRRLVNAVQDALVQGGHVAAVLRLAAAITDVPLAIGNETVVSVSQDQWRQLVITDQRVYALPADATVSVAVADFLPADTTLADAYQLHEFQQGTLPTDLQSLMLTKGYLSHGYFSGLTFHNKEVPLVVDTSGVFTKVSFEIGGWPGDVARFWEEFHDKGVAAGRTLAHCLDVRSNPIGEPTAFSLPATINPLQFLAQHVFRQHGWLLQIRLASCGPNRLPLEFFNQLRRIVPPHTGLILLFQLDLAEDEIDPAESCEETLESLTAGHPMVESLDPAIVVAEALDMFYISGVCL